MSARSVAIVTDSTADLPPRLAAARSISVVPLTLHFDGRSLLDGVDITPEEFYRKLPSASTHPTTSQPSPGRFAEIYSALLEDHDAVVSIHISEKLSGTFDSARQAAAMADPKRIRVIDSGVGMSPEFVRQRLFRPFETTKTAGMGIGVYESSQYVVGLGGQLLVDSTPEVGTRVSVLLPLADGASAAAAPMTEAA